MDENQYYELEDLMIEKIPKLFNEVKVKIFKKFPELEFNSGIMFKIVFDLTESILECCEKIIIILDKLSRKSNISFEKYDKYSRTVLSDNRYKNDEETINLWNQFGIFLLNHRRIIKMFYDDLKSFNEYDETVSLEAIDAFIDYSLYGFNKYANDFNEYLFKICAHEKN